MISRCPDEMERLLWLLGEMPEAEKARVGGHLRTCTDCAADLASLRRTVTALEAESAATAQADPACLDQAQLAAWVEGTLEDEARARVLSHLAACPRCRRSAASLAEALKSEPIAAALAIEGAPEHRRVSPARTRRPITKRIAVPVGVAAAAVIAGLLFVRSIDREVTTPPAHRESTPVTVSSPVLEAPVGGMTALEEFRWSAVTGADRYRLTVFDERGSVVWEFETAETRAAPSATAAFEPGAQYLWKVAARLRLGRWVSSDLVAFTISEP